MAPVGAASLKLAPTFFQPYAPPVLMPAPEAAPVRIYFKGAPEQHGDFVRSNEFVPYRDQVAATTGALAKFCLDNQVGGKQCAALARHYEALYPKRFHNHGQTGAPFYDGRLMEFDRAMPWLDAFAAIITRDDLPLTTRKTLVQNLAEGIGHCADGALGALSSAYSTALQAIGGFDGLVATIKAELASRAVDAAAHQHHGWDPSFANNHTHYFSQGWNTCAPLYGLDWRDDPMNPAPQDGPFIQQCLREVEAALTPDSVALAIAERAYGAFLDALGAGFALSGSVDERVGDPQELGEENRPTRWQALQQALQDVSNRLGVPQDLFHLEDFVRLSEADGTHYALRADRTMLTARTLQQLNIDGLAEGHVRPIGARATAGRASTGLYAVGETAWMALALAPLPPSPDADEKAENAQAVAVALQADGMAAASALDAHALGDTATVVRLKAKLGADAFEAYLEQNFETLRTNFPETERDQLIAALPDSRQARLLLAEWRREEWAQAGAIGEVTIAGLLTWAAAQPEGGARVPPASAVRQAIQEAQGDSDRLRTIDARWLEDGETLELFAEALGPEAFAAYGRERFDALTSAIAESADAVALLTGMADQGALRWMLCLLMESGNSVAVAEFGQLLQRFRDIPAIAAQLPQLVAVRDGRGGSALYAAILTDNVDLVHAYGDLLGQFRDVPTVQAQLADLLAGRDENGKSALYEAILRKRTDMVRACGDLFQQFRDVPAVRAQLAELLAGKSQTGSSALYEAILSKNVDLVRACGALFQRFHDEPAVRGRLAELLAGKSETGRSALHAAILGKNIDLVRAYGDLLAGFSAVPAVRDLLPQLLAGRDEAGRSALHAAIVTGHVDMVRACGDLLARFRDVPAVRAHLAELLAGKNETNRPALYEAILRENPALVAAYGDLLDQFRDEPTVQAQLAELLAGKSETGRPALYEAFLRERVAMVRACRDLFQRFRDEPTVQARFSDLLAAKSEIGRSALNGAVMRHNAGLVRAFGDLLGRFRDEPAVQEKMAELLAGKSEVGRSALHEAVLGRNIDIVFECGELFHRFRDEATVQAQLAELLAGKDETGRPAIAAAILSGRAGMVRAYSLVLKRWSDRPEPLAQLVRSTMAWCVEHRVDFLNDGQLSAVVEKGWSDLAKSYGELFAVFLGTYTAKSRHQQRHRLLDPLMTTHNRNPPAWLPCDPADSRKRDAALAFIEGVMGRADTGDAFVKRLLKTLDKRDVLRRRKVDPALSAEAFMIVMEGMRGAVLDSPVHSWTGVQALTTLARCATLLRALPGPLRLRAMQEFDRTADTFVPRLSDSERNLLNQKRLTKGLSRQGLFTRSGLLTE